MPATTNIGHPRVLRRVLGTLLGSSVVGVVCVGTVVACGGDTTTLSNRPDCEVEKPGAHDSCSEFSLEIKGDVDACPKSPTFEECRELCGTSTICSVVGSTVRCPSFCIVDGRRPEGLAPPPVSRHDRDDLGGHFAEMAYHEAAAVHAFAQLVIDLRAAGAPASLLRALRRAEKDERRHAELATTMARRHGCEPSSPDVVLQSPRSLFAVALENAVEGCGRELLGAAVGLFVAEHAADRDVRDLYASVARDEVHHAAVSLRMQRWIRARLTAEERGRVDDAMFAILAGVKTTDLPPALGGPDDAHVRSLGKAMGEAVASYLDRAA